MTRLLTCSAWAKLRRAQNSDDVTRWSDHEPPDRLAVCHLDSEPPRQDRDPARGTSNMGGGHPVRPGAVLPLELRERGARVALPDDA